MLDLTVPVAATGPVAPGEAWRRYAELELWPAWSPQLARVEASAGVLAAGVSGRVVGPLGVWAAFAVLEVEAPERRWTWQVSRGPVTMILRHGLDPVAGGTRAWLRIRGPGPLAAGYAGPAWVALRRLVTLPTLPG